MELQSSPFILINYYAPNEEEDAQLICGGDFNSFFDCKLDADGRNPKLKIQSIIKLVSVVSENDLCDIFRVRNPEMKCSIDLISS